ncbi:MAG: hypothetical protein KatS3mg087_1128 [Patescibacteria group bacterium]|nr:MAG: hypothetical protein KatS3mg087_1128 [Patescibacteria group bacterium]
MAKKPTLGRGSVTIALKPPLGGVVRKSDYQSQEPFTTPHANNVWPIVYPEYRKRLGKRAGIGEAYRENLALSKVNLLSSVHSVVRGSYVFVSDDFLYSDGAGLSSAWNAYDASFAPHVPTIEQDNFATTGGGIGKYGAYRTITTPPIDFSQDWIVEIFIWPSVGYKADFYLTALHSGSNPKTNGVVAKLRLDEAGRYSGAIETYVGGTLVGSTESIEESLNYNAGGWFTLRKAGTTLYLYWKNRLVTSRNISADGVANQNGFGFMIDNIKAKAKVKYWRAQYITSDSGHTNTINILVASANGNLYRQTFLGTLGQVSTNTTLNKDVQLSAAEYKQKLYIADYGPIKVSRTDGQSLDKNILTASGVDFVALGVDADDDVVTIFDGSEGVITGHYVIASVSATQLVLEKEFCNGAGAQVSFRIHRGPKVFDPATNTLSLMRPKSGKGTVPANNKIVVTWRDRLVFAGSDDSPHNWFMSRAGDVEDWLFGDTDPSAAVSGTTGLAGQVGEPITALIPHRDTCMYIGTPNSLWIMLGDPAAGGELAQLSKTIGVVSQHAWAYTADFEVVFMSRDGLYIIQEPCGKSPPQSISRERIPAELLMLSQETAFVSLGWDYLHRGIHIFVTPKAGGTGQHWFLDWENKGFWRMSVPESMAPIVVYEYFSEFGGDSSLLIGCKDGQVRRFHAAFWRDDDKAIRSFYAIGPLNLGGEEYYEGIITQVESALAMDGGHPLIKVAVADYAAAFSKLDINTDRKIKYSGRLQFDGLNPKVHPRVRGSAGLLIVDHDEDPPWLLESLVVSVRPAGNRRVSL